MIHSFDDIVSKMKYHLQHKEEGYNMPMVPKYNGVVGNILPGVYTAIAGLPSAGTTSFVDENYVMNVLLQWYLTDEEDRKPLKVFYFALKDNELKKMQSLLCHYLKVVHNIRVDIQTLNSQPGRIYDLEDETEALDAIDEAQQFFQTIYDNEVLEIVSGTKPPSAIFNAVTEHMHSIGSLRKDGSYEIEEEYEEGLVMAVIDSTAHLEPESDGYSTLTGTDLDAKMDNYILRLIKKYSVNCTIIVPAAVGYVRTPKDTEPHYRHLGYYGKNCEKGIELYNPIAEGNKKFLKDADEASFVSEKTGMNILRCWEVVRNTDGPDSVKGQLLFLPGTSYMVEIDETIDTSDFDNASGALFDTTLCPFYKGDFIDSDDELEANEDFE